MNLDAIAPLEVLARLGVAFFVGALIGFERERTQRPAGLRTHILVALASALFGMVSIVAAGADSDPGRIAAQVVTGIGFLGAGTIMRHGSTVKGLTTAASLWTAAALGLAVGFGWYLGALAAALLAFLVLIGMKYVEVWLVPKQDRIALAVTAHAGQNPLPGLMTTLASMGAELHDIKMGPEGLGEGLHFIITASAPPSCDPEALTHALRANEGVRDVEPGR